MSFQTNLLAYSHLNSVRRPRLVTINEAASSTGSRGSKARMGFVPGPFVTSPDAFQNQRPTSRSIDPSQRSAHTPD
jgi:hypothetical protein